MTHTALELIELGAVFFGLGLLGRLAGRIGLSPIPLYLLGGLAFGTGGLLPLAGIGDFTEIAAEVGVVLLLFTIGIEFSLARLARIKRLVLLGGGDQVLGTVGVTAALLLAFGVSPRRPVEEGSPVEEEVTPSE